jgi:hypothetical protein
MEITTLLIAAMVQTSGGYLTNDPKLDQLDPNTWVEIGYDASGSVWKMRIKDIKNQTNYTPTVWIELDHSKDKTIRYRNTKTLITFDCQGKKSKTLSSITYFANGTVKDLYDPIYPEFHFVAPDTIIEVALEAASPKN